MADDDNNLAGLKHHWGSAYVIEHSGAGLWVAQRRDNRESFSAGSAAELFVKIRRDYDNRPVPRGE